MSDRLDRLLKLAPRGFSIWSLPDGAWQLNLKTEDSSFSCHCGRDLDSVIDEGADAMRFRRLTPGTLRDFAATVPGTLKPTTPPRTRRDIIGRR